MIQKKEKYKLIYIKINLCIYNFPLISNMFKN